MQSHPERNARPKSIVGQPSNVPAESLGVFRATANMLGVRLFQRVEDLVTHVDAIRLKFKNWDNEFMIAVTDGDVNSVKSLLEAGADPLAPTARVRGWGPMHEIALRGDVEMLDVIAEHVKRRPEHADVFTTGEHERYRIPALVALDNHKTDFVERMIDLGQAHLTSIDRDGRSGLSRLAHHGHVDLLNKAVAADGHGLLKDYAEAVRIPLQHEAVIGMTDNRLAVVQMLQAHGIDVFARNALDGGTLLHTCAYADDGEVMRFALNQVGTDPNARNNEGMSALHIVAAKGNHGMAQLLLDKGADPNTRSIHDESRSLVEATPLMLAAAKGNKNTVDVLLDQYKIDVARKSISSGLSATDYARRNGHNDVVQAIENGLRRRLSATSELAHKHLAQARREAAVAPEASFEKRSPGQGWRSNRVGMGDAAATPARAQQAHEQMHRHIMSALRPVPKEMPRPR